MIQEDTTLRPPGAAPDAAPDTPPAAPAAGDRPLYGWLFLVGLAAIFAFINPIVIGAEARLEVSLALLALGGGLLAWGLTRRQWWATAAGAVLLWADIMLGTATQLVPLGTPAGIIWGPRGLLLAVALLGWAQFMGPPRWLWRGLLAAAVPTFAVLGMMWTGAPRFTWSAGLYWLAVDSQGAVYATGNDDGSIWQFHPNGTIRGQIWPRRAPAPGTPAIGYRPAGPGGVVILPGATPIPTLTPGGPSQTEVLFCGLAVDPQDHLYFADVELRRLLRFDREGQVRAEWPLPATYIPARGCLAADADHVYLADRLSIIYVYDHQGTKVAEWPTSQTPQGLSFTAAGRLLILHNTGILELDRQSGREVAAWALPPPTGPMEIPYQAVLGRANGEVMVSNLNTGQIMRFDPNHQLLAPWAAEGDLPGQFRELAALAEDRQGRVYATDFIQRVIQRFTPDGRLDAVWTAPTGPPLFEEE
jgi:streptogramin lyase